MKTLFTTLFVMCVAMTTMAQQGTVVGAVMNTTDGTKIGFTTISIEGMKQSFSTSRFGAFKFSLDPGIYHLTAYEPSMGKSVLRNVEVKAGEETTIEFAFPICEYNEYLYSSTCPYCNKSDQIIPIVYGYPSEGLFKKAEKGEVKLGGCVISDCDPHRYCKRDEKEF